MRLNLEHLWKSSRKTPEKNEKLFVLIFTLTLSTNAFSWGGDAPCDKFLDYRKSNAKHELVTADVAAFTFYIFGMMDMQVLLAGKRDKRLSG